MEHGKAILLSRVSTLQQDLLSQTEAVKRQMRADGWSDEQIILIENKESAVLLSEEEMLGITEMKEAVEQKNAKAVYVFELSRLSRRPKDLFSIRDWLISHKVQLVCLNPFFKMLNPLGELDSLASIVFGLFASINENEGMLRKQRVKRAKDLKRAQGKIAQGKPVYGYSVDKDKNVIVNIEEAKVVKKIFQVYSRGNVSMLQLCRDLRSEGYLSNYNSAVNAHTGLSNMLKNKAYIGEDINGTKYPAIIDKWLFNRVQEVLPNKKPRMKIKAEALGKSLLQYHANWDFNIVRYWEIHGAQHCYMAYSSKDKEHKWCVNIEKCDEVIWSVTKQSRNSSKSVYNRFRELETNKTIKSLKKKIEVSTRQLAIFREQLDRLEERIVIGTISIKRAEALEDRIKKQITEEEKAVDNYKKEISVLSKKPDEVDLDSDLTYEQKHKICCEEFSRIMMSKQGRDVLLQFMKWNGDMIGAAMRTQPFRVEILKLEE